MRTNAFLKRLRRELPGWVERGWVRPGSERAILEQAAAQDAGGPRYLAAALAVLGALLLGSGVISFFAANWGVIPKLGKLAILFGGMWAAYGVAYFSERRDAPQLAPALLLLGVILFGANIWLIAQVYHIEAHYPDGVLLWALGALLAGWLLASQAALIAALALAALWTGMEAYGFERAIHWPFFLVWAPCLLLGYRHGWRPALHVAAIALLLWCWNTFVSVGVFGHDWPAGSRVYLVQLYLLLFLALYILGRAMAWYPRFADYSGMVHNYAAVAAMSSLYLLTSPHFQEDARWGRIAEVTRDPAGLWWLGLTAAAAALVAALVYWRYHDTDLKELPRYRRLGLALLAIVLAALIANLFVGGEYTGSMTVGFNLLFFSGVVWLIYTGIDRGERFMVNLAFTFFALGLLARYFDTFWTLLNRSFFFMAGGLLLIAGGYTLERQRRRLTARIAAGRPEGGA